MVNNNKFVPVAPKIYEVRYVENKEPSKLIKFASYLGIKTVENCNEKDCKCVATAEEKAKIAAAVAAAMAEVAAKNTPDTSVAKVNNDGTTTVTYTSNEKK